MDSNFIKAGLKALAAIVAVVTGGTLAKKAHDDYKRGREVQESKNSKPVAEKA